MQKMPAVLRFVPPMECKTVARIPEGGDWQYELKLDDYRAIGSALFWALCFCIRAFSDCAMVSTGAPDHAE